MTPLDAAGPHSTGLHAGAILDRSVRVATGRYRLLSEDDSGREGAITVRGDGIAIDFHGAVLEGSPPDSRPDERKGTAIVVDGGRNVTIENAVVRGYRIGLIARNCPGLRIRNCDFSYNWKQHLLSTLDREDESDWLSYHQNEKDEWLRYGCGIYLRGCDGFEVKGTRATGGQNGLMLMECGHGSVSGCDFSFLSGCGLALYRSSDNRVMNNRIDWCIRGYSHGVYNRGQDSAGIIVYEQSSRNIFAYNSVTHGGDGFFLWAGQTTMDTGEGGCNDNLLYANDFSFAATNGIEATFSRNLLVNNRIEQCWHGIWGGFSYDSLILGNRFRDNDEAIAIEHGQNIVIRLNQFESDRVGVHLWANPVTDSGWGYPKHRDTASRDYLLTGNVFADEKLPLRIESTERIRVEGNDFRESTEPVRAASDVIGLTFAGNAVASAAALPAGFTGGRPAGGAHAPEFSNFDKVPEEVRQYAPRLPSGRVRGGSRRGLSGRRGREFILVDEWGPYDFRSPRLWPRGRDSDGALRFEVLGPPGRWSLTSRRGTASVSPEHGVTGDFIKVHLTPGTAVDMRLELTYRGGRVVSPLGVETPRGEPYGFSYSHFFAPIDWDIRWYWYDRATEEPRSQAAAFHALLQHAPLAQARRDRLDLAGYGPPATGVPGVYFATVADGTVDLPDDDYVLNVVSDDGVRAWVDDRLVIDNWTYHVPTLDTAALHLAGRHRIHIEHFQIDGYWTLKATLEPHR